MIEQQVPGRSDGVEATVGQLLDAWLSECVRMPLSPTTLRSYRAQIERTIRPGLGSIKVARLGAKDLDDLYRAIKAEGCRRRPSAITTRPSLPRFTRPFAGAGSGETSLRWPSRHASLSGPSGRLRSKPCGRSWLPPKSEITALGATLDAGGADRHASGRALCALLVRPRPPSGLPSG